MISDEQGVTTDRYVTIPRTLIFITYGDCVLLLKGAPDKRLWANQYNGVGGHIERGEDVLTAAKREVFEETGLSIKELWLRGIVTVDTGQDVGIVICIFLGEAYGDELKPSPEGTLEWVQLSEIDKVPLVEDLTTILPLVFSKNSKEIPFLAHYSYDKVGQLNIRFGV